LETFSVSVRAQQGSGQSMLCQQSGAWRDETKQGYQTAAYSAACVSGEHAGLHHSLNYF